MAGMVKAGARMGRIRMLLWESKRCRNIRWRRITKRRGKKRSRKMNSERRKMSGERSRKLTLIVTS